MSYPYKVTLLFIPKNELDGVLPLSEAIRYLSKIQRKYNLEFIGSPDSEKFLILREVK